MVSLNNACIHDCGEKINEVPEIIWFCYRYELVFLLSCIFISMQDFCITDICIHVAKQGVDA